MKPIGIGKLNKADPIKPFTRHERNEIPLPSHAKIQKPQAIATKPSNASNESNEQEGQLSVDVYQTETEIIILAPIAGTAPNELNLSITDDVITIKGRRERPVKKALNEENIYLEECFWGNFSRSIILPAEVDTRKVEARFKHNILTIRVPRVEIIKTRKIEIAPGE